MPLSAGDRLGRYEVLAPLGAGGMGEVYRARDTELERDVAIKVLPAGLAQNPDRLERFRREAKAVAKLAHPNILEIWDYGHEGEITFSVTELLEGETLRERLEGAVLSWRKASKIGTAIAEGLATAHQAGILHRDLKPSNVFLTSDGRVKILDFGLARLDVVQNRGEESQLKTVGPLTEAGMVLGTAGYMSPEQVRGEPVDYRSDIFSLGCILYQAVSGRGAFARDTAAETMAAVLNEEPHELSATRAILPQDLERAIQRCLEKRPESRFQSASDLAFSLRAISTETEPKFLVGPRSRTRLSRHAWWLVFAAAVAVGTAAIALWVPLQWEPPSPPDVVPNKVAIAPLDNRTGEPPLDGIGEMAADLIAQGLTRNRVAEAVLLGGDAAGIAASAETVLRRPREDRARQMARALGAGLLVSGSYYGLENSIVQLQARLIDVATEETLYAFQPVSAPGASCAQAVELLRDRIVAAVAVHLDPGLDITVIRPPASFEAFLEWKRAGHHVHTDEDRAADCYQRAIDLDPTFAVAHISAVSARSARDDYSIARTALASAEESLQQLTPFERAWLNYWKAYLEVNLVAAHRWGREMLERAPHLPWVRTSVGSSAVWLNRPHEAIDILVPMTLGKTQPTPLSASPQALMNVIDAYHMLGEYRNELAYADAVLMYFADNEDIYGVKARALAALGETDSVFAVIDNALSVPLGRSIWERGEDIAVTASELRAHGYVSESVRMANRALEWFEGHPIAPGASVFDRCWYAHFHIYALRVAGRWDEAKQRLQKLTEEYPSELRFAAVAGIVAAREGDLKQARHALDDVAALDHLQWPAWHSYWLTAIAAHLGEKDRAVDLLRDAFARGERHSGWHHQAIDLEPLWDYPPFQELIRPKG
jgi:tetratricopeptide (TPR) repeat protein